MQFKFAIICAAFLWVFVLSGILFADNAAFIDYYESEPLPTLPPWYVPFAEGLQTEKPGLVHSDLLINSLCNEADSRMVFAFFRERSEAEEFIGGLRNSGREAHGCRGAAGETGPVFYAYMEKDPVKSAAFLVAQAAPGEALVSGSTETGESSVKKEGISGDVFEKKTRTFHPYLSVTGQFTDNVFASKNKESDFILTISPGIWLSFPTIKRRPTEFDLSALMPGGMIVDNIRFDILRRFQAYISYHADIDYYSKHSSLNDAGQYLEGRLTFRSTNGVTLELADVFQDTSYSGWTGISSVDDDYYMNFFRAGLSYEPGMKLLLRADYTNVINEYHSSQDRFKNRVDNGFAGAIYYKVRPRTSIFVEYDYLDITYDEYKVLNSEEHHLLGGIQWNITAKTDGLLKAGYAVKKFERDLGKTKDFIYEARVTYRISARGTFSLTGWRKPSETDSAAYSSILVQGVSLGYHHLIVNRLTGSISGSYAKESYKQFDNVNRGPRRDDTLYSITLDLSYEIRNWLTGAIGYRYDKSESSYKEFNYDVNNFYVRLSGAL